ncbi:PREDICTED: serine/threonine-protein kinase VRK1-like [Amphimedon queenslandica]|nr:PREDICTED: serine/threonine-protein kinase VRK1-like [Amphimedon queenslandica]|eukprot:XP_019848941.1 PREDICTED: serine/threonine-protein kinase VRK1-like [Amphimedon queenslandica]
MIQIEAQKKKAALPVWKATPSLPDGTILSGFTKREWRLEKSIRNGGFGLINEVSPTTKSSGSYAIKVKPQDNGPLFCEVAFYRRAATSDLINDWVKSHDLKYLAIPQFIDCGKHESSSLQYRFLIMKRFGDNIEKLFEEAGSKFGVKTVCYLALRILEALEYLHDSHYVHANIKGAHILTGYSHRDQVYLVDYGLAFRYSPNGEHKPYKPDPRRSHDGTIEFTSIDAHDGASPSRRGDLEILGYCLLQWSCGRLPWEDYINDMPMVASLKRRYKDVPTNLIKDCFKGKTYPKCLKSYMESIYKLSYEEIPKYENLKNLFFKELKDNGMSDDGTGLDWISRGGGERGELKGRKRKHDPEPETEYKAMPKAKGRKMT